jgi:hypothetical protein
MQKNKKLASNEGRNPPPPAIYLFISHINLYRRGLWTVKTIFLAANTDQIVYMQKKENLGNGACWESRQRITPVVKFASV